MFYNLFTIIIYHSYTCPCYFLGGVFAASALAGRGTEEVEGFEQWFPAGHPEGKAGGMAVGERWMVGAGRETPPRLPTAPHGAVAEPEDAFPAPHWRPRWGGMVWGDAELTCVPLPLQLVCERAAVGHNPRTATLSSRCLSPAVGRGAAFLGQFILALCGHRAAVPKESVGISPLTSVRIQRPSRLVCVSEPTVLSLSVAFLLCTWYKPPTLLESSTHRPLCSPVFCSLSRC